MGEPCRRITFFLVTLVSAGVVCFLGGASLAFSFICGLDRVAQPVVIAVGTAAGVSLLVFVFAVYASCCGKVKAHVVLSIVFLVFAGVFVAVAVLVWVRQSDVLRLVGHAWDPEFFGAVGSRFEQRFGCKGWSGRDTCEGVVRRWLDVWANVIGGVALGGCVLACVGAFVAINYACCLDETDSSSRNVPMLKQTLMLSRGW